MRKTKCIAFGKRERNEPIYDEAAVGHLIRRMPGKSRSILAHGDDNDYYILKFAGNPTGGNSLANEILGYQLAEALRLHVPKSYLVTVPPSLISYAPADWFDGFHPGLAPSPGLHFGTKFLGSGLVASTFDLLPRARLPFLENRRELLGMLVFDIWANKQEPRQIVFKRGEGPEWFAYFIDFKNAFGGPENVFCDDDFSGFYFDVAFYEDFNDFDGVDSWISLIRNIAPNILAMTYAEIPRHWHNADYHTVRNILLERLERLEDLVYPVVARLQTMKLAQAEVQ